VWAADSVAKALIQCSSLRVLVLKRMRIESNVIYRLAQGFSHSLEELNLSNNHLLTDGVKVFKQQLLNGEGKIKQTLAKHSLWRLKTLHLADNELTGFGFEHIEEICK
jgi:hypothetical protein